MIWHEIWLHMVLFGVLRYPMWCIMIRVRVTNGIDKEPTESYGSRKRCYHVFKSDTDLGWPKHITKIKTNYQNQNRMIFIKHFWKNRLVSVKRASQSLLGSRVSQLYTHSQEFTKILGNGPPPFLTPSSGPTSVIRISAFVMYCTSNWVTFKYHIPNQVWKPITV